MLIHKVFTFSLHVNRNSKHFVNFFSDRVGAIQKAKRMTVSEVLDYLEISPPMFSMIKSGKRNPSVKTIRRIESAEREAGIIVDEPPAVTKTLSEPSRGSPSAREAPADGMPDHRDLSKKLDEILRRLSALEKKAKK